MSDTPTTDAAKFETLFGDDNEGYSWREAVPSEVCRKLERERDEARSHRDLAVACYDELYTELCGVSAERYEVMERQRRTERERDEAREALRVLFKDYKQLADSGDAGFWNLEDKDAAQPALRILKALEDTK